jgi:hypothetical protein
MDVPTDEMCQNFPARALFCAQAQPRGMCHHEAMLSRLIGKPVLLDKLNAELPARISLWIAEDTKRAQARKKARAKKRAEKRAAKGR